MSGQQIIEKPKSSRKLTGKEIDDMKKRDHKMVSGIFHCYEPRGGSMTFSFKKYKGDNVLQYTLTDGEKCDLPLMVAKHLNQNCWYPKHSHVLDADGNPSIQIGKKEQRCSFESLEFQDFAEDAVPEIAEAV